ncbi:hypothetical protein ATO12_00875 [Aquimarina atlantica]|uniref:Uncharacterized protein n=1 Tax=Aquimarina atlantica TaxID=1317122 RepID=A0A023BZ74_9FLAO|nr:hypothetical protein [Aquimarina atlantica]EZH75361.1 hypothetical protein ATO12_00875 [Aquimarina atlantica]
MDDRLELFLSELKERCSENNSNEFEYFWEMWGVLWMPWFIEINGESMYFTTNDISQNDLDQLHKDGFIELLKIYDQNEMKDEFDRKRYRLIET